MPAVENILDLYLHAAGKSSIPTAFHRWTCLTTIAATVSDQVYMQRLVHAKIIPNMYTMLVGPSGVGKGASLSFGMQFLPKSVNVFQGGLTAKALIDYMSRNRRDGGTPFNKLLIVSPELSADIGTAALADSFVRQMTEWYELFGQKLVESTRTHGMKTYDSPVISWAAGTTEEWLTDSVSLEAIQSGFFGRTVVSREEYDYDNLMRKPKYPRDQAQIIDRLKRRYEDLSLIEGPFEMTPEAEELEDYWWHTRRRPQEGMEPFWMREPTLLLKLAMICSLTDSLSRIIEPQHVQMAIELVDEARAEMPRIMRRAGQTPLGKVRDRVEPIIQRAGRISRKALLRRTRRRNLETTMVEQVLRDLMEEGMIRRERGHRWDSFFYLWEGSRPIPREEQEITEGKENQ